MTGGGAGGLTYASAKPGGNGASVTGAGGGGGGTGYFDSGSGGAGGLAAGGIYNASGATLNIADTTFSANKGAGGGGGGQGSLGGTAGAGGLGTGAIYNLGTLNYNAASTTFTSNEGAGGKAGNGGAAAAGSANLGGTAASTSTWSAAPTVTLSIDSASVAEAAGTATVTATLSAAAAADTTVTIGRQSGSTATLTDDFTLSSTTITITAGQTTGTATLTAVQDALDEADETAIIEITGVSGGGGATESGAQQQTVTIIDDDPTPSLSVANVSQVEGISGSSNQTFTVTLSAASAQAVSVGYATSNGTATAGSDYTASSGTLTFAPGETTKTFTVAVAGDTTAESDEAFTVTLSGPSNATLGTASATGTIQDDDSDVIAPSVSSITRVGTATTNATSVDYTVAFSEAVTGVGASDFGLTASGSANGAVASVTGSGSNYTVTVNSITGDGTLRLDLNASGTGITDGASNAIAGGYTSGQIYTFDHTAPSVTGVTSTTGNGTYTAGGFISIQVNFNEAVTVTGTPTITLETGSVDRSITYASGSGTNTLTFTYTVQAGDTTADLDYVSTTALALNGGTISDSLGNDAILTLAAPGATGSLGANRAITIDTTAPAAPSVPGLRFASDSGASNVDGITNVTTPTFTGTAEAGATVTLYDTNGVTVLGTAVATGGVWSITSSTLAQGAHTLTAKATDAAGNVSSASVGLTVTIDTTAPAAPSVPDLATASDTGASNADNITSATTPTFTGTAEAGATVTLYDTDSFTVLGTAVATGGVWTITSSTLAQGAHTLTAKATDAAGNVSSASVGLTVSIVTANTPPAVTTSGGTRAFVEGANVASTPVAVDSGITLADADNATLASATVAITGNFQSGQDMLGFTSNPATMGNVSASYNSSTGVLTLSSAGATATLAQWQAALQSITYSNSSETPSTSTRTISFVVNDGTDSSSAVTRTVTVAAVNDAPMAVADSVSVAEGGTATTLTGGASSVLANDTDAENDELSALLVTGPAHGTLTLNANGTFSYTHDGSETTTDSFTYKPNDGTADGNPVTVAITVAPVNDAPVNTVPGAQVSAEDTALVFSTGHGNQLAITDMDAGGGQPNATLSVTNGTLTLAGTAGLTFNTGDGTADSTLVFTGTLADINTALSTLTYLPAANYHGGAVLTLTASDGTLTDSDIVDITVSSVNDAPTVAAPIANQNVTEDTGFNFQFAANAFADVDVGDSLTYTAQLAGGAALPTWLSFDAATRTFSGTPLNGDVGTLSIDVTASDGTATVTDTFTLVVANTNDAPTVANAIPDASATEDAPFTFQFAANAFADVDVGDTLTYSAQLAGGAALPTWLTFNAA
ncbi:Ig-like domain-containing protein, partial [Acidovorax sp. T1m]|uniref:beta strand repeat-containing protein n=2 Tax=unclassified Acidovorax TaxID=2684926 RepID=UPI001177C235